MACTYCVGAPDWVVKKFDLWTVYLKKNQAYLGTVVVALNRHVPDLWSATAEELGELQMIVQKFRESYKDLFGAKMFAYMAQSSLENLHANLQIIPRYSEAPRFFERAFPDPNFGRGFDPTKLVELQPGAYSELIDLIKDKLEAKPEAPAEGEEVVEDESEEAEVPRP